MLSDIVKYFRPHSIEEALSILARYKGEARVIGGGTKFVCEAVNTRYLIDLTALNLTVVGLTDAAGFINIESDSDEDSAQIYHDSNDNELTIGATISLFQLENTKKILEVCPELAKLIKEYSHLHRKSISTLGGSLISPLSCHELGVAFLALGASVVIRGKGLRTVDISTLYEVHDDALIPGEILCQVRIPVTACDKFCFKKITLGQRQDSLLNCAVYLDLKANRCENMRIAFGHLEENPVRCRQLENFFTGKEIDREMIKRGVKYFQNEVRAVNTFFASAEYKEKMAVLLFERCLMKTWRAQKS